MPPISTEVPGEEPAMLRKLAEQLALERARLAEVQSVAKVGSWELDLRTNVLTWSDENYRVFEIDKDAFEGTYEAFLERVHPDDRAAVNHAYLESLTSRLPYAIDHRMRTSDGHAKIVHERCQTFYDGDGKAIRSIGTSQDVTESRLAEAALHDSRQALRAVLDSVPQRVFWKDRNSVYLGCNRPFATDMGFDDPKDVIGKNDFDATWKASAELYRADDRGVVLSGQSKLDYEEPMVRADGREGWLRTSKVPLRGRDGSVTGIIGTYEDITESKRLQAGMAQADRLSSMGMLAAGVAHEINNPLAYVLANIETLAQGLPKLVGVTKRCCAALRSQVGEVAFASIAGDDAELLRPDLLDEVVECAQSALEGTHRIKKISRGLGSFSRVERLELTSVDLSLAIDNAATMAHNEVKYRASMVKDFGKVPSVLASDGKLSQVFLNLIINAAHAIGEGRVESNRITVRTWATGNDVFAEVADTGPGIPTENLERIFEPFFSTKKAGAGSGLGLAICRKIVTEFGGDLRVESEPGKGARFIVRLPANSTKPEEYPGAAGSATSVEPTARGRILVVDDEEQIRKVLLRLFGQEHEVVAVASGREAQALLEKDQAFDIILCDLMIPEMTGMELHAWLAARVPALARQVVFITGGAFTPTASAYLASVGNLQIEKPFDQTNLKKLVSELILSSRGQPRLGSEPQAPRVGFL